MRAPGARSPGAPTARLPRGAAAALEAAAATRTAVGRPVEASVVDRTGDAEQHRHRDHRPHRRAPPSNPNRHRRVEYHAMAWRRLWSAFLFLLVLASLGASAYLFRALRQEQAARAKLEGDVAAIGPRFEQFKDTVREVGRRLSATVFQE